MAYNIYLCGDVCVRGTTRSRLWVNLIVVSRVRAHYRIQGIQGRVKALAMSTQRLNSFFSIQTSKYRILKFNTGMMTLKMEVPRIQGLYSNQRGKIIAYCIRKNEE